MKRSARKRRQRMVDKPGVVVILKTPVGPKPYYEISSGVVRAIAEWRVMK
jgi:hypothetical protein